MSVRDVSVVIVTYNSEAEIGACLDAVAGCGQVIVVDNASGDGTVREARRRSWVEVVANPSNRGFAAAVNQGARLAQGRHLLLLNPDAVVSSDCSELVEASERTGIAAGCLTNADGTPQAGFSVRRLPTATTLVFECLGINRLWPRNPVNVRYRCLDQDLTGPARVEQPAAAFLMIRRDVFDKLGGFDEQFWPVWFEDVDFCRRAADSGCAIEFVASARARHAGAHSVRRLAAKYQCLYWYGSLLKYAGKHYNRLAFRVVCVSVLLGSLIRLSAGVFYRAGTEPKGEYNKVLELAAAGLIAGSFVCPAAAGDGGDGRKHLESRPVDER